MTTLLVVVAALVVAAIVAFGVWQARLAASDADAAERAHADEKRMPEDDQAQDC